MSDRTAVDRFMATIEKRIRDIVRQEMRAKTGVVPGGPYTQFSVNSQGWITWAGGLSTPIVELLFTLLSAPDTDQLSAWDLVTDTLSITSIVTDYYDITIPSTGQYRFVYAGNLEDNSNGWDAGDFWHFDLMVNSVNVGTVATLTVASSQPADTILPISGQVTLSLTAGDVVNPVFTWDNTPGPAANGRGQTGALPMAFRVFQV